jgi:hypothetical protein
MSPVGIDDFFPNSKSMAASLIGAAVDCSSLIAFSIVAKWSAGAPVPVGILYIEISNANVNRPEDVPADSWSTDTGTLLNVNGAGDQIYNFLSSGHRWIRPRYDRTSGAGTITRFDFNGKGV